MLNPAIVGELITQVESQFGVSTNCEITLEANPGTINLENLIALRHNGVNRLSLGIQSFNDGDLQVIGRIHSAMDAETAIQQTRAAGFDNLSLDLIFGTPGQTLQGWQENMLRAIDFGVEHLSLYALILEDGTPFASMVESGELTLPDEDLVADMYEWAMDELPLRGYQQYEISNWSRGTARQAVHNKVYWHNLDYLGIGAGAHGRLGDQRYHNLDSITDYINAMTNGKTAVSERIPITNQDAMQEQMMLGLRLTDEGVSAKAFASRFAIGIDEVFGSEIEHLIRDGLLEWVDLEADRRIRLTRKGILFGNRVFREFV